MEEIKIQVEVKDLQRTKLILSSMRARPCYWFTKNRFFWRIPNSPVLHVYQFLDIAEYEEILRIIERQWN